MKVLLLREVHRVGNRGSRVLNLGGAVGTDNLQRKGGARLRKRGTGFGKWGRAGKEG